MKKIKILGVIFLTLTFTKCASTPNNTNPPFSIIKGIYQNWTGGIKGISGVNVTITYTSEKEINFKELFFRGKKRKVKIKKLENGNKIVLAKFNNPNTNKFDLQLQGDAKKEFGNKPSKKETDIPFELKDSEAIISYLEDNELKYFKLKNLEKGKPITLQ